MKITKYLPSGGESGQVSDVACQEGWGQKADVETDFCDIWICEIVYVFVLCLLRPDARRQMSRQTSVTSRSVRLSKIEVWFWSLRLICDICYSLNKHYITSDLRFVKKSHRQMSRPKILHTLFHQISIVLVLKMSENGEIYTAGKKFTLPPAVTAVTNLTSALH